MNADEAKREAVKVLASRFRGLGVSDPFKHAENFMHDMALAGWIWMPPANRRTNARPGHDCRTHPGEWADSCRSCAADRLVGEVTQIRRTESTADVSARVLELRRNVVPLHTKTPKPPTEETPA